MKLITNRIDWICSKLKTKMNEKTLAVDRDRTNVHILIADNSPNLYFCFRKALAVISIFNSLSAQCNNEWKIVKHSIQNSKSKYELWTRDR